MPIQDSPDVLAYRQKQMETIAGVEQQLWKGRIDFSTVAPIDDYANDPRITLTSVHFPKPEFTRHLTNITDRLKRISPEHFYYPETSLHMTVKNIRVISNPVTFTEEDITKAKQIFADVVPGHFSFHAYFHRLLLFPYSLSIMATTDPELDSIILDLDTKLTLAGIPDDKKYSNNKYFFGNITLARFSKPVSPDFVGEVEKITNEIHLDPYRIDSISLITGNAALTKRTILGEWQLK